MTPRIEDALKSSGERLTRPRKIIARELQRSGKFLSTQGVYERISIKDPRVDLATVYRTLNLLCRIGAARRKYFGDGQARYGLHTDDSHQHAHCEACGAVIEFGEELTDYLALQVQRDTGFVADSRELTLHGHCASCVAREPAVPSRPSSSQPFEFT